MKIISSHICTSNNEIEVGKQYQYYESLPTIIFDLEVIYVKIDDENNRTIIGYKIVNAEFEFDPDEEKELWFSNENYAYGGMFRIYDLNTYLTNYNGAQK